MAASLIRRQTESGRKRGDLGRHELNELVQPVTQKTRSRRPKRRQHAQKCVAARLETFTTAQTGEETA